MFGAFDESWLLFSLFRSLPISYLMGWSDVAGGLFMPSQFAHYFSHALSPVLQVHDNVLSLEESSSSMVVSAVPPMPSVSNRRCRQLCPLCHGQHTENVACACRRCGYRHVGDCVSVCHQCHRVHPPATPCRTSGKVYLTAKRRASIVFGNDDDGIVDRNPFPKHDLGLMVVECPHCRARSWRHEKLNCCHGGDVVVEWDIDVPLALSQIILSSHVRQNIRSYNTVMAFASTGHDNKSLIGGTFVLSGRAYHRIGPLLPGKSPMIFVSSVVSLRVIDAVPAELGQPHSFAQIWALDTDNATQRRQELMPSLRCHDLSSMHDLFIQHNHLARSYRCAVASVVGNMHDDNSAVGFTWSATDELTRFEIASVIESAGFRRQIVIQCRGGRVQTISDGHRLYHALAYPLLFPLGNAGWHDEYKVGDRTVSLTEYMRFLLMHRQRPSHVQRCERLALEFYCDAFAQVEARNLAFHKLASQQAKYQSASARAIIDQLSSDNARQIGVPVILPASFPNSTRYYHNL